MFKNEYRVGAFAGMVALILVLALTVMAFTALEPAQSSETKSNWSVSMPEPAPVVVPSFGF